MIRPTPTSPAGRVLALIADEPGEHDSASLAGVLSPYTATRVPARPLGSPAEWRAWRVAIAEYTAARDAHRERETTRVSRVVSRLVEAGLVEPATLPVELSPGCRRQVARLGVEEALRWLDGRESWLVEDPADYDDGGDVPVYTPGLVEPGPGGDVFAGLEVEPGPGVDAESSPWRVRLVERLLAGPVPCSDLAPSSASGARRRAYRWLVGVGAVWAPGQRRATEAGAALVASWRREVAA